MWVVRRVLRPVIGGLSLALAAVAISTRPFRVRGMVNSMVCTPLCNHSPAYDHHTLKLMYSIARSPTDRAASTLATPAPRLICAQLYYDPSELSCHQRRGTTLHRGTARGVQVHPSRCGRRRGEWITEGACVLNYFVTCKAWDPMGSGLSAREHERRGRRLRGPRVWGLLDFHLFHRGSARPIASRSEYRTYSSVSY